MILDRLREQRYKVFQGISAQNDPQWGWPPPVHSGVVVDERSTYGVPAFYALVRAIAEPLGMVPRKVFERTSGGRKEAKQHRVYRLVHDEPNPLMDAMIFFESIVQHAVVCGDGFGWIEYDGAMRPVNLWLIRPDRTRVERRDGRLWYYVMTDKGIEEPFEDWEILHIRGFGWDGTRGYRIVELMAESIGIAIAGDRQAASFHGGGIHPAGVVEHPKRLGDKAEKNLRDSIEARHMGASRSGRLLVLEEGAKWQTAQVNAKEAQLLEGRMYSAVEMARFMRVPASEIDAAGGKDSLTYSTLEQDERRLFRRTFLPWGTRLEMELNRKLFSEAQRDQFYIEHVWASLLQADTKTLYEALRMAIGQPFMTANEGRERINLNKHPDGDELATSSPEPGPAVDPGSPSPAGGSGADGDDDDDGDTNRAQHAQRALTWVARDAAERVLRREFRAIQRALPKLAEEGKDRIVWGASFYAEHETYCVKTFEPVARANAQIMAPETSPEKFGRMIATSLAKAHVRSSQGMLAVGNVDEAAWMARAEELAEALVSFRPSSSAGGP